MCSKIHYINPYKALILLCLQRLINRLLGIVFPGNFTKESGQFCYIYM